MPPSRGARRRDHVIRRHASRRPPRPGFRPSLPLLLGLCACLAAPVSSLAGTALDLSGRMLIDGLTDEWESDESLLQTNDSDPGNPVLEESLSDSKWGFNNDLNQIRLTWDANFLYVAVNAIIWGNNTILLFDYAPGGLCAMTELNSWRRNFVFKGITPDMFLATWDGNTAPQVWKSTTAGNNVSEEQGTFVAAATFSQGTTGRAMEAAIPWTLLFGDVEKRFVPAIGDSMYPIPAGIEELRVVAVLTAGADGTGGPDSAPDNLRGHSDDSSQQVTIDNWAVIPLDLDGPGSLPDGYVDLGADIRARETFRIRPPVKSIRYEIDRIDFNASVISPEQGGRLEFDVAFTPEPSAEDLRSLSLSAEVFNVAGVRVRTLFAADVCAEVNLTDPSTLIWDGRDDRGRIVDGGVYVLRLALEPDLSRKVRALSVVR